MNADENKVVDKSCKTCKGCKDGSEKYYRCSEDGSKHWTQRTVHHDGRGQVNDRAR